MTLLLTGVEILQCVGVVMFPLFGLVFGRRAGASIAARLGLAR